jgi:hypothetical protein
LFRATLRVEALDGTPYGEAESEDMVAQVSFCARPQAARVIVIGRAGFGQVSVLGKGVSAAALDAARTPQPPP